MEEFPTVSQPYNLDIQLYPHQLTSVYRMEELERTRYIEIDDNKIYTEIGINADITGYGKTMSMVALILRDKMKWEISVPYKREKLKILATFFKKNIIEYYQRVNTTLILVNKSMVKHWEKELSHTNLNFISITKLSEIYSTNISEYDVVIVIPTMYNSLIQNNKQIAWKRFIFDEPSSVKVPSMQTIISGFNWLVTATPEDIYIKHRACKNSFMKELMSSYFSYIVSDISIKNDSKYVTTSYIMPKTNNIYHKCFSPIYNVINGIVDERIVKLVESGNIDTAICILGGTQTDNIVELVKKNKLIELEEINSRVKIWKLRGDEDKIKEWEEKYTKLTEQISQLEKRFSNILSSNCPICYEILSSPVIEPNCHNVFCSKCLLSWLCNKNNCPLCRKDIQTDKLIYINNNIQESKEEKKIVKTKEEVIIQLIKNKPESKFILFSDYFESFYTIRKLLNENSINFVEIKGTTNTINNSLEKYKEGNVNVMFMNSKTDNSGLNLENTTDIILYHTLDENITKQVIGRANRIGRKKELFVHHLIF